ncbi:hypothetical protein HD_1044 [[Haemophilus] ducreyi 35000HP]|uniref:Uncharacterized protein n=1 Tax=Haemophilus ducreyi (strain 35000HP / ATCC 700724) TaxID=233412 RepID=Q7VMD8_HAEDU|nr:hypothetical protein HD_1044 [[Haemophilus] ducreyi 35000HP]
MRKFTIFECNRIGAIGKVITKFAHFFRLNFTCLQVLNLYNSDIQSHLFFNPCFHKLVTG